MKYFIDTEFIEGFRKPIFGKKSHFIDLISIGIVAEDGREYYAISNEWKYNDADDWVKQNVIAPIYIKEVSGDTRNRLSCNDFHWIFGKSNDKIAEEIKHFCNPELFLHNNAEPEIEFYGYYADYDWVLFCSLFGKMIDLPNGFPMYCKDLKQMIDEKAGDLLLNKSLNIKNSKDALRIIKEMVNYPIQQDEHNALCDAKWNYQLFNFLKTI